MTETTISQDIAKPITKKTKRFADWIIIGGMLFAVVYFVFQLVKGRSTDKWVAAIITAVILAVYFISRQKEQMPSIFVVAERISKQLRDGKEKFMNFTPSNIKGILVDDVYYIEFYNEAETVLYDWKKTCIIGKRNGTIEQALKELQENKVQSILALEKILASKRKDMYESAGYEVGE